MTDLSVGEDERVGSTTAIEDIAAGWVVDRCNQSDWTQERQATLDEWLAQSLAHRVAYVRIEASWRRSDRLAALRGPMRERLDRNIPRKIFWGRIVAVFGLAIVTGVFSANQLIQPKAQLIETPKGGQERLTLADGSQIELNTDSAVRIDLSAPDRAVELVRGEAYFQIKHDPAHPFVVTAANRRIVDLGTRFVVRANPQSLQIALLEGRVRLESMNGQSASHGTTLLPGDIATATAETTTVSKASERNLTDRLAWQHGSIVFHNASLADVVAEFNRYGGPQLVLTDPKAANLTINGTFRITGGEDFAANAHEIFGLRVERKDGAIVLSR